MDLNDPNCSSIPLPVEEPSVRKTNGVRLPSDAIFVDATGGNDDFAGDQDKPVKTIAKALELVKSSQSKTVVLRGGIHTIESTLVIDSSLNGLTITGHAEDKEDAVVSGGVPMSGLVWKEHDVSNTSNIWVASLDEKTLSSLPAKIRGLQHETLG